MFGGGSVEVEFVEKLGLEPRSSRWSRTNKESYSHDRLPSLQSKPSWDRLLGQDEQ